MNVGARGGRVLLVFGPPACGTSTALSALNDASETQTMVLPFEDPTSIAAAEEAKSNGVVVFLDVDGGTLSADDIQELNDARLITRGDGGVVRLWADDFNCMERAKADGRPDYVTRESLRAWSQNVLEIEERLRGLSVPYFMVDANSLEDAVRALALRAGIRR